MNSLPGKLRWRCRRGTLELDLILQQYLDANPTLDQASQTQLSQLLDHEDGELWDWINHQAPCPAHLASLIDQLRQR